MPKLSLRDLPVKAKKVLMRVDFNVPMDDKRNITDDTRIVATLPSIRYVLDHGGALVLMSHLGRPKDKRVAELSLEPCAKRLSQLLGKEVLFAPDCVGPKVEQLVNDLKPGQVLLLENLRFYRGEEHPEEDKDFVRQLAKYGDVYVNDAFGTAHRAHASTEAVARLFPGKAAAGLLLEKEIQFIGDTLSQPKHPFVAIIGGSKISSKCGVIESLMRKADTVLIGGGMAYTFFKALGLVIGNSIHEDEFLAKARELLAVSGKGMGRIVLPTDIVIAKELKAGVEHRTVDIRTGIPEGYQGVDIGVKSIAEFTNELKSASTILWNGPLGVFEVPEFAIGTDSIARVVADAKATTIVGGGDSIAALQAAQLADRVTHLSTGGGATLEYIEYGQLPGIEVLTDRD